MPLFISFMNHPIGAITPTGRARQVVRHLVPACPDIATLDGITLSTSRAVSLTGATESFLYDRPPSPIKAGPFDPQRFTPADIDRHDGYV
jgi:hypothetical protein